MTAKQFLKSLTVVQTEKLAQAYLSNIISYFEIRDKYTTGTGITGIQKYEINRYVRIYCKGPLIYPEE